MRPVSFAWSGVLFAALVACGDSEPCMGPNGPCIEIEPGADEQTRVQTALIQAVAGDIILFKKGIHEFELGLSLDVAGVTIRGEGMNNTILSFAGQIDGAQGLLVTGDDFTIEDIAVVDTAGDAIKVEGTTNAVFRRTRAEWTNGPSSDNGAYGLYPVQVENVLIEDSVARAASDAGIYVGQSRNIIVRNNLTEFNVAGIEIENSFDADVYGNTSTNNTGGILIFNLPGLPVMNGARARVFDNDIVDNNTSNFAPPGNIVGKVPKGTGFATIAAHDVEVFDNRFANNQTSNTAVISYLLTDLEYDDPTYVPYSDTVYIHGNSYIGGGDQPVDELGFVLVQALITIMEAPLTVPDIVFDGYLDPAKSDANGLLPQFKICVRDNGDADFAFLDAANDYAAVYTDLSKHDCEHPPLAAISLPGLEQ